MVFFKARFQALEYLVGVVDAGLHYINFLEATTERLVLVKNTAVFLERRGAYTAQFSRTEQGLEQVAGIHHTARSRPCANNGMHFVNEQDGLVALLQLRQQVLETLLEIPAILGAREQSPQIK